MSAYPVQFINISKLQGPLSEFDNLYADGLTCSNLNQLQGIIQKMTKLQEDIISGVKIAPPSITRFFNWGVVETEKSVNPNILIEEVQNKLNDMIFRLSNVPSSNPKNPSAPLASPFYGSKPIIEARDLATGFGNMAANCWANSLLSMVIFVPSLKTAYLTVAEHYLKDTANYLNQIHGNSLKEALTAYALALSKKQPVDYQVTQTVRTAFHHFFGQNNSTGLHQIFSDQCSAHEDAYEALQVLMGRYEDILKKNNQFNPPPGLYCPIETKRLYKAIGNAQDADPSKITNDGYSKLKKDNSSSHTAYDYQILLDLQNKGHLSFSTLLSDFFRNSSTGGSEPGTYLREDGKVQKFTLTCEARQFTSPPQELLLNIKRFGAKIDGQGFKILDPVMINRIIALPADAIKGAAQVAYALDAFIVHKGGFGTGHYICYKKINDRWIEADDGAVRFVEIQEIDQILHGQKSANFTSYLHHYVRVPPSQQLEAIASVSNSSITQQNVNGIRQLEIERFSKEIKTRQSTILALEKYNSAIEKQDFNSLPEILKELESLDPEVISTFRHVIWLHGKTPNIDEYGTKTLHEQPKILDDIRLPWLFSAPETLHAQMSVVQSIKLDMAEKKLIESCLLAFIEKLNNPSISNEELRSALTKDLPERIQWELHGLIYQSHLIKFGEKAVDKPQYGKTVLENGDLRKTLSEATESVLNLNGKNIVEQLASSLRIKTEKIRYAYEKEQLMAFYLLLKIPAEEVTNHQLVKAFERLDVRADVKDKLFWSIWVANGMPNSLGFGTHKFTENPRCLIAIKDNILASPPLCENGADVLLQMITLLEKEAS